MKILLTGATGYIGKRLLPILVAQGHEVICCVRDKNRFYCPEEFRKNVLIIEVDFLKILLACQSHLDNSSPAESLNKWTQYHANTDKGWFFHSQSDQ
mgnify:CR=1 FL=1